MLKASLCVFASLLCSVNPANAVNPTREIEPNNTMATATQIAIADGEFRGQISTGGLVTNNPDVDFFVFASPGGVISFQLDFEPGLYVTLNRRYSASVVTLDGFVIGAKTVTESGPAILTVNPLPGTYYLKIDNALSDKDYIINSTWAVKKRPACPLDIDGDGNVDALTDGLMLLRIMFGLTGASVTNNAVSATATRPTWADIRPFLNSNCGTNFP